MIWRSTLLAALGMVAVSVAHAQSSGEKAAYVDGKASAAQIRSMMLGASMEKGVVFGAPAGGAAESGAEKGVRPDTISDSRPTQPPVTGVKPDVGATTQAAGCPPDTKSLAMPLYFELNSAQLSGETRRLLGEFASVVRSPEFSKCRFLVIGHTDARGGEAHNQALSEQRAEAVRTYLVKNEVTSSRLIPVGKGKREPYDEADPYSERNRRVEFRLER